LSNFSAATIDADSALRTLSVDSRYGTTLYDAITRSSAALRSEPFAGRAIILVTDGQETTSKTTLDQAILAARSAHTLVYPIAIESGAFSPVPLKKLARETGGAYYGVRSSSALAGVYAAVGRQLRQTWRLEYLTAARPGDVLRLRVALADGQSRTAVVRVPGSAERSTSGSSRGLIVLLMLASAAVVLLLVGHPLTSAVRNRLR
jgi:hypothetical protein